LQLICSKFAALLLQICCKFAANLPQVVARLPRLCRDVAARLPLVCRKIAASLPHLFRMFAAPLPHFCCNFAIVFPRDCLIRVSYMQIVNIFRVVVLGGPQNQSFTRPNAHLQECGNESVRAPDGHPRLVGDSYGFAVLREDAQCMAGGAQKWTSDITEGAVDLDQNRNARCKGDDHQS
jgi:hypothetical protein